MGAELAIHGSGLRDRWTVAVGPASCSNARRKLIPVSSTICSKDVLIKCPHGVGTLSILVAGQGCPPFPRPAVTVRYARPLTRGELLREAGRTSCEAKAGPSFTATNPPVVANNWLTNLGIGPQPLPHGLEPGCPHRWCPYLDTTAGGRLRRYGPYGLSLVPARRARLTD